MQYPEWIWHNGAIKPWAEATTHVMSHALHYGSSVFEGIRSYQTPSGPAIFRLSDHNRRLYASARIYDMQIPFTLDEINAACRELLRRNELTKGYLRPLAYRGLGGFGLSADTPVDVAIEQQIDIPQITVDFDLDRVARADMRPDDLVLGWSARLLGKRRRTRGQQEARSNNDSQARLHDPPAIQ